MDKVGKALEQMKIKEDQIRYKKVGRRYVQCNDPYAYEGLREGYWLVRVTPGCTSIRQYVFDYDPEVKAALNTAVEKIVPIISKAMEFRPQREVSEEFAKDFKALQDKYPDDLNMLYGQSHYDIAQEIVEKLNEQR